jgi:hypothetical protein
MLNMFSRQDAPTLVKHAGSANRDGGPATAPLRLLREATAAPANATPAPAGRKPALERRSPNIGQYLHHLQHDLKSYVRAETVNAVIGATPGEIQRIARIVAKLKGRYLATLMDLGNASKGPIGESEVRELRRSREMYEEVELGLARLREAVEAGDLELDGVRAD